METLAPRLILVPTDFSAPAAHAMRYAAALGRRFGAHLLVIFADPFVPPVDFTISAAGTFDLPREELMETAREQLQAFAEAHISTAMPYEVRVIVGTPTDAIAAQVRESGANLIVMGTHGRTGLRRLLFGSVTEAVMRTASVPVIAVPESAPQTAGMQLIAGRATSTPESRAAVRYAGALADVENARYVEIAEAADVVETARSEGADLIALGISGERGLADAFRGTVVERVVQHSVCPVLTVNRLAARSLGAGSGSRELAISGVRSRP